MNAATGAPLIVSERREWREIVPALVELPHSEHHSRRLDL